jgi:predicted DNA binding CopG/RHH family protein
MMSITNLADIPAFASEADEDAFWTTHELSDELAAASEPFPDDLLPPPPPRTVPVSFRFDAHTLQRAKRLAATRGTGYQTLLKEFVIERLYEEEKKAGLR